MTGSNVWAAETGCTSFVLHTKTNVATEVESCCMQKQQHAEKYLENLINCNLVSWVHWVQIMCTYWYILYFHVDIASLLWIKLNSFHLLSLLLNSQNIFREWHLSLHLSLTKSGVSTSMSGRNGTKTFFCCPISQRLLFLQKLFTQCSKVETLNKAPLNFHLLEQFLDWVTAKLAKSVVSLLEFP
jgi:hypothetical protein